MQFVGSYQEEGNRKTVVSDNGNNFVGAAKELKAAIKELNHSGMQRNLVHNGKQWNFNPPLAHISVAHGSH